MPDTPLQRDRAAVLERLRERHGYPGPFLRERAVSVGGPGEEPPPVPGLTGLRLTTADGATFLWVATASDQSKGLVEAAAAAERAEEALRATLDRDPTAGMGLLFDGATGRATVLRRGFFGGRHDTVPDLEAWAGPAGRASASARPLTDEAEALFFEVLSHIRDIDGLHAPDALDEVCKLILLKLHDEGRWVSPEDSAVGGHGNVEELAASARARLRLAASRVPAGSSGARAFDCGFALSSAALARCLEELSPWSLGRSQIDVKGRAFQRILVPAARAGMGQYLTPDPIVRLLVNVLGPRPGESVIDPFAGSCRFLSAAAERMGAAGAGERLVGIEKSARMVRVAWADAAVRGGAIPDLHHADALLDFSSYEGLDEATFDLALTNPPFGSVLGRGAMERLGRFELLGRRKSCPLEVLGLERTVQWLRPGGRFAIVLPAGVFDNRRSAPVRAWLRRAVRPRAILSLPSETFVPLGANVRTVAFLGTRLGPGERNPSDLRVLLGGAAEPGELDVLGDRVSAFLAEEGW